MGEGGAYTRPLRPLTSMVNVTSPGLTGGARTHAAAHGHAGTSKDQKRNTPAWADSARQGQGGLTAHAWTGMTARRRACLIGRYRSASCTRTRGWRGKAQARVACHAA